MGLAWHVYADSINVTQEAYAICCKSLEAALM